MEQRYVPHILCSATSCRAKRQTTSGRQMGSSIIWCNRTLFRLLLALCMEIILDPRILAIVIRFAELSLGERQSYVCCAHAKHRSVAVGVMLQILMRFNVDFTEATSNRSSHCCGESALANAASILCRLREVPMLHCPPTTLAAALELKEWKSAFWGDHRRFVPY